MTQGEPKEILADKGYKVSKLQDWLQYEMKSETKIKIPIKLVKILSNSDPNLKYTKTDGYLKDLFPGLITMRDY